MNKKLVLEKLKAGRERIKRGFCKHVFGEDKEGNALFPPLELYGDPDFENKAVSFCIRGAVLVDTDCEFVLSKTLETLGEKNHFVSDSAGHIAVWNNYGHTTQADVIKLFDKTIDKLESEIRVSS